MVAGRERGLTSGGSSLRLNTEVSAPAASEFPHDHTNEHFALIYESQKQQFDAVSRFLRDGLENHERCLYVADDNTEGEVIAALQARGMDIDRALESGALSFLSPSDTYLRSGSFDADDMLEFWEIARTEATDKNGFAGIRAAAEMTWALDGSTQPKQLVEYEALLNPLYEGEDYVVLCQYNRERFSSAIIHDVIRTHPLLIYDGARYHNVYYTPPEEFFGPRRDEREVERMLGTFRVQSDAMSQVQKRERQLEKSEQQHRTLIENFPNGLAVLYDHDLRIITVGGEDIEKLGVTVEDAEGGTPNEVFPYDFAEEVTPHFQAAIKDGVSRSIEIEYGDSHYQLYTLPVHDNDDNIFAGMAMAHNITVRKASEQYLRDAKSQLEVAAEAGAVGTWEWNIPEDKMVTGKAFARLFGVDPAAARAGTSLENFVSSIHKADQDQMKRKLKQAVASCGEYEAEYRVWNADGELRWVVARGHVECDEDGNPETFPGALTDITERKCVEEEREELIKQLEASNDRLEQFAHAASHDLQEPLRMISTYLQLIEDRYDGVLDEDGLEFLDFAIDGADRMREMVRGLREFSRIRTEGTSVKPIELDDVLDDVLGDLERRIAAIEAEIVVEPLPVVSGDARQLRQLFRQLLENAIIFSGSDPPVVEITAEQHEAGWLVCVRDKGIGIPADKHDQVFEIFKRLHTREDQPGAGVGLALCEQIAAQHGGKIWIESDPGAETAVYITLPAAERDGP